MLEFVVHFDAEGQIVGIIVKPSGVEQTDEFTVAFDIVAPDAKHIEIANRRIQSKTGQIKRIGRIFFGLAVMIAEHLPAVDEMIAETGTESPLQSHLIFA